MGGSEVPRRGGDDVHMVAEGGGTPAARWSIRIVAITHLLRHKELGLRRLGGILRLWLASWPCHPRVACIIRGELLRH
jgi:hypothetical protein